MPNESGCHSVAFTQLDKFGAGVSQERIVVPSHLCFHQYLGSSFAQIFELLEIEMSLRSLGPVLMNYKLLSLGLE